MDELDPLSLQLAIGMLVGWAVKYVKLHPNLRWIKPEQLWKLRGIAAATSALAALGIHYSYEGSAMAGGVLTVMIPGLTDIVHGLIGFGTQYMAQGTEAKPEPVIVQNDAAPLSVLKG